MISFLLWAPVLISCVPHCCKVLAFGLGSGVSLIMFSYVAVDRSAFESLCFSFCMYVWLHSFHLPIRRTGEKEKRNVWKPYLNVGLKSAMIMWATRVSAWLKTSCLCTGMLSSWQYKKRCHEKDFPNSPHTNPQWLCLANAGQMLIPNSIPLLPQQLPGQFSVALTGAY